MSTAVCEVCGPGLWFLLWAWAMISTTIKSHLRADFPRRNFFPVVECPDMSLSMKEIISIVMFFLYFSRRSLSSIVESNVEGGNESRCWTSPFYFILCTSWRLSTFCTSVRRFGPLLLSFYCIFLVKIIFFHIDKKSDLKHYNVPFILDKLDYSRCT